MLFLSYAGCKFEATVDKLIPNAERSKNDGFLKSNTTYSVVNYR